MATYALDLNAERVSVDDIGGEVRVTFALIGPTEVSERRINIDAAFKEALEAEAEDGWLDDRVELDVGGRVVTLTVRTDELERGLTALDRAVICADEVVTKGAAMPIDLAEVRTQISTWATARAARRSLSD